MRRFWKYYDFIEEFLIVIAMILMVALNFINVICRKFLPGISFSSVETITIVIFAWTSLLGIGVGYKRYAHSRVTFVIEKFSVAIRKLFVVFSCIASVAFLSIILYYGIVIVKGQVDFHQLIAGTRISAVYAGLSVPVGAALIIIRVIHSSIQEFKQIGQNKQGD